MTSINTEKLFLLLRKLNFRRCRIIFRLLILAIIFSCTQTCAFTLISARAADDDSSSINSPASPDLKEAILKIDSLLDFKRQELNIPGLSAAIVLDQETIFSKGYGYADFERKIPADSKTIYRMASITKLFTATMLMQLRDEGKLSLDDPVTKYFNEIKFISKFPDYHPPSLRQLVSHLAGLPKDPPGSEADTFEKILKHANEIELVLPSYLEFKYSNLGIAFLGGILSKVAQKPYTDYVMENILIPLKMSRSNFTVTPSMKPHFALPYKLDDKGHFQQLADADFNQAMLPVGGLLSSAEDMSRFVSMQFNEGARNESNILGAATLREMHSPVFLNPDWQSGIGIGWFIEHLENETVISHSGQALGFITIMMIVPEKKLGILIFSNTLCDAPAIAKSVLKLILPALKNNSAAQEIDPLNVPVSEFPDYIGHYVFQEYAEFEILESNGKLIARNVRGPEPLPVKYIAVSKDVFRMKGGPFAGDLFAFLKDKNGKVTHIQFGPYLFNRQ